MRLIPAIPRDPVARLRLLSLWFALFTVIIAAGELYFGRAASPTVRLAGLVALILLGAWFLGNYRRGRFPEFATPIDAVLLVVICAASSMPLRAMGVFLATVQFRAVYVSRREFWIMSGSFALARALGMLLTAQPAPYGPLSPTVALQGIGMVIIGGTMYLLVAAIERQAEVERALDRSEERYRVLAQATQDMVYEWNILTGAVDHTDAIHSTFGFLAADVMADRTWWRSRIHAGDRERYDAAIDDLLAGHREVASGLRYRIRLSGGEEAVVVETAVVRRDAAGTATRVIGSVRNVTAEHRLEDRLRQSQKMEAVGKLAGGVAHDFNNLLTVIGGHVYMIEQSNTLPPPTKSHLDGIVKAADRAGALTRQLLAFGRKQVLKATVLDLNEVVRSTVPFVQPVVGERIRVVTDLTPDVWPVLADAGQLEQVLLNLAINARDAMPDGGTLTIATANVETPDGSVAHISVTDTGVGMDPITRAHVFEPFFTTKSTGKGTGLGLATAYGIIKQSFGDIFVDSAPGKGSTFTIELPITHQTTNPVTAAVPPVAMPAGARGPAVVLRLLLVEDDDGVREFAREVLSRSGYDVVTARDGAEGLAIAKTRDYAIDVVVTDLVMPEMGGRRLVENLRRAHPSIAVLFMSGYADDPDTRRELGTGSDSLLEKPFTAKMLRDAVSVATNPVTV